MGLNAEHWWISGADHAYPSHRPDCVDRQRLATLASAVVGYQAINTAGVRLLDAEFVNAVLVLVVVTCVIGPILTEHFLRLLSPGRFLQGKPH